MKRLAFFAVMCCILLAVFCFSAMTADTGELKITGKPGIRIYLDDKPVGVTKEAGLRLEGVQPGKHDLRAEEAESGSQRFNVHVKAGKTLEIRIGRDGGPMALIPAGEFQMGSQYGEPDETPVHKVYLDAFYMDMYEVTNALYERFIHATGYEAPRYWNDPRCNAPNQPVVGVTWQDAQAYCKWAGKRLPTEAEWEKAARGGLVGKEYPWGDDEAIPAPGAGGYQGVSGAFPVGSFAPNDFGLYDMARNAWEWCADWYGEGYYSQSPERNPTGPASGNARVLRGGSWFAGISTPQRVAYRYSYDPEHKSNLIGFRCVEKP